MAKLAVQLSGDVVPLHATAVGAAASTVKLSAPVGGADPEKLTRAVNPVEAVPKTIEIGLTITVDTGWDETVKEALPLELPYKLSAAKVAVSVWLPATRPDEAKLVVQLRGELAPVHVAAVAEVPSILKLRAPVGALDPVKLTRAVKLTVAVP